jgi:hypothetical protein
MDRKKWLAIRDSGSLGQFFRSRSRFIHISKTPAQCANFPKTRWTFFGSRRSEPGTTYRKAA